MPGYGEGPHDAGGSPKTRVVADDGDFLTLLVMAWGVGNGFSDLADSLTPPPVNGLADHVECAMHEAAKTVWEHHLLSITRFGSTSLGTDIVKSGGELSDRNYSLAIGGGEMTDQEWGRFSELLARDARCCAVRAGRVVSTLLSRRAIRFRDARLGLRWEVVSATTPSGDFGTYPTLQGTACRSQQVALWGTFYENYPGARNATKVLKRLFPDLPGHVVEGLVFTQGRRRLALESNPGPTREDVSGFLLFEQLIQAFLDYPSGSRSSTLWVLLQDAERHPAEAHRIAGLLQATKRKAEVIHAEVVSVSQNLRAKFL